MRVFTRSISLLLFCFIAVKAAGQSSAGTISGGGLIFCDTTNTGFISLGPHQGAIVDWQFSIDGGSSWNSTQSPVNTASSQSYFHLTQTTCYRVIVDSAGFPPDTSAISCLTVFLPSVGGTISGGGTFCGSSGAGTLNLSGNTGSVLYWQYSINGGISWTNIADTTTLYSYPNITQNTIYEAVVRNGASCPSDTSSQAVFIIDPVSNAGVISGSDTVCFGVNFGTLNLSGYTGAITQWISSVDNGSNWNPVSNNTAAQSYSGLTQTTLYAAIVKSGSCPSDTSLPAQILVTVPSVVSAGNDTTILLGASAILHGMGTGSVVWLPATSLSSNNFLTPTASPSSSTAYVISVTDSIGCVSSDAVTITVILPQFNGEVANLITPNGDGINDSWYIKDIQNFPENEVFIYNIYGNKVFDKKGYVNDWQGTYNGAELPDGTYYYVLKLDDKSDIIKGSVDILRNK